MGASRACRLSLATGALVAVAGGGAMVAGAVPPQRGAVLTGTTSHLYEGHRTGIRLAVAASGERISKIDFPACAGENKGALMRRVKVAADGSFSAKRSYRRVIEAARSGGGSDWDLVYDWKARIKGRFTSPTTASGTLRESYHGTLRDTRTGEPRDGGWDCKTGRTTWHAELGDW